MKSIVIIPLVAILSSVSLRAQSAAEREFDQARADREKQVAAAVDAINRRYKDALDKLFRRATQEANLDLASKIRAELQALGGAQAVAEAGRTITPARPSTGSDALATKNDLKKLIENTRWDEAQGRGQEGYLLFYRNGEIHGNGPGLPQFRSYELQPPDMMKIMRIHKNAKKGEKPDILTYRIDVSAMTLTLDEAKSTAGGVRSFKYAGPAPKK
jgi:hypothetical protein